MDAVPSIPRSAARAEGGPARLAGRAAGGHTTDARTAREVVFYRLGRKFVDHERSIPEDVRSVLYYTLAIGHHTGVIDCLEPRIGASRAVFAEVLDAFPAGPARDKLAGVERFGEIELGKEHVGELRAAVRVTLARAGMAAPAGELPTGELPAGGPSAHDLPAGGPSAEDSSSAGDARRPYVHAVDAPSWLEELDVLLGEVEREPQVYVMGRRVTP
ncbi:MULTISPECIES: formate hydrogenlyase maturation HycH family protein [unclassified Adlercreutzia]|uniref:formate hydrogenlyase maturation HycH family protein n=1 Tax=unclassified Adlercreutzia TaxID=2636013 RepID=UPI0013EA7760|nr:MULTISPECIES: formate hydrogenlyase maturation HycH family protein [unclassified Adlercreutzia]